MKKLLAAFLILCALTAAVILPASAEGDRYLRGDADCDENISILDATAIQRVLVDLTVKSFNEQAADVDGDGLNIIDATSIQRYLVDLGNPYNIDHWSDEIEPSTDPTTQAPTEPPTQKPTKDPYELPFIPAT